MKKNIFIFLIIILFISCNRTEEDTLNDEYIYYGIIKAGDVELLLNKIDANLVGAVMDSIKSEDEISIESLTAYINKNFDFDGNKAYAIYYWMINNIEYDYSYTIYSSQNTFDYKRGVCDGQASLFCRLAYGLNMNTASITGSVYGSDYVEGDPFTYSSHQWSAICIAEKWYLLDVTWHEFITDPDIFVLTHIAEKTKWNLK